jgi:peptide/nickel transport system substrate-binding protein
VEKRILHRREFLKKAAISGSLVIGGISILGCAEKQPPATPTPEEVEMPSKIIIAWPTEMTTLHPYKVHRNMLAESPVAAILDRFLTQDRDLKYQPGILEEVKWSEDKLSLTMKVRKGVVFHDGTGLTAEDVVFSFERMKDPGNAYSGVWKKMEVIETTGNYEVNVTLSKFDPSFTAWLGFLDAFVVSKEYWEKVGEDEFGKNPVGSGPYKVKSYGKGVLELEAHEDYWMGSPPVKEVVFKEVLDPKSRAAEIESLTSDFTLQIDITDFTRLDNLPSLKGIKAFVTDVAMLFVAPYKEELADERVRLALHYAIDKKSIVDNVLLGFGRPVSTTEAPGYMAYDPNFTFPYDLNKAKALMEEAGYSKDNPLRISVMTTKGFVARDFEVMQAIAGMWREIGVEADIETITLAQFFEFRNTGKLANLALYVWSNATGDPINSIGYSQWPNSPFSAWRGLKAANLPDQTGLMDEATQIITPLFTEKNEEKRIESAKVAARWVVEKGLVIPLYQLAQPLIMRREINYEPWPQGYVLPYYMSY